MLNDDPVDLDNRRSKSGLMETDIRRKALKAFEADQKALRLRQEELEEQLLAEPAETWPEAAAKAQYLLRQYADTNEAQHEQRQDLIERALSDLTRLMERDTKPS